MPIAITRQVSAGIGDCELTHLPREPIDVELARRQHHAYEQLLAELACEVVSLPAEDDLPDAVFVEDTAIVLDEIAVLTRPGAENRRAELHTIAPVLSRYRELREIEPPATLDGGDVLLMGKTLYVGASSRSSEAGVQQLRALVGPFGYRVVSIPITNCLHLKSAVTQVGEDLLLANPAWVDPHTFGGMAWVEVDPSEPMAANALWVGGAIVYPTGYPLTEMRLTDKGVDVRALDVSELQKAEGGVTCCSLILSARVRPE